MRFILHFLWILCFYILSSTIFDSLLNFNYLISYYNYYWFSDDAGSDHIYDYIIVGAGSAGCVLAARLAEQRSKQILLIEAGGKPFFLHDIPIAAPMLQMTPYDWKFKTVPQEDACLGTNERRSVWPRGKMLGGTSRLNYLMYMRGHKDDFAGWTEQNCKHWSIEDVQDYFKRSEAQLGRYINDTKHHGTRGIIPVSDLDHVSGLATALTDAALELGLGVGDLNGAVETGFMQTQTTTLNGARFSADRLLEGKQNIKIMLHTQVTKVLMRHGFEAYGVQSVRFGHTFTARARRDVIISAGTIGTPHLLMLSGIGPAHHLTEHNIKVSVDLPVGENLQDHIATGLDLVITNQSSPLSWKTIANPLNPVNYFLFGQGPLTHPGCEMVGLVRADGRTQGPPDIQIMALPGGLSSDAGVVLKRVMGISDKLFRDYFASLVGTPVATLLTTLLHPRSKGWVRLASPDPLQPPLINPRYLAHPEDSQILVKGIELLMKLAKTEAMAGVGASVYLAPLPPCSALPPLSAQYWKCYVRHLTVTAYHPVGTCRMGSVVDRTLRVIGTSRLRVVDASIMPTLPSANINAAVMMIAEKAADLVNAYWQSSLATCQQVDVFFASDEPLVSLNSKGSNMAT